MKKIRLSGIIIYTLVTLFSLCCILPMVLVFMVSITDERAIGMNGYSFFPQEVTLDAYAMLFENGATVLRCYANSIFVTAAGTVLAVMITAMASYSLANPSVKYRNGIAMFFFVTMVFNGGMVPWYMICKKIGLSENYLALLIPNLIFSPFNLFLVRNYMSEIPASLMESASWTGPMTDRWPLKFISRCANPFWQR